MRRCGILRPAAPDRRSRASRRRTRRGRRTGADGEWRDKRDEGMISCVAWLPLTETKLRFKNDALQAVDLRGEGGFSCRREAGEAGGGAFGSAGRGGCAHPPT